MSLLRNLFNTSIDIAMKESSGDFTAATPQNKAQTSFSLLANINGSELTNSEVVNHLQKVDAEEDAVDTVAFGLETTEGDIVKVYVNAAEADSFELRMAQLLGKIDDIDQAIEELSDEFDIVSVVKPGEMDAGDVGDFSSEDGEVTVGIENQLDEPLGDDDIVQDLEGDDLISDEDEKDPKKDSDNDEEDSDKDEDAKKDEDPESGEEDKDEKGDDLSFDDEEEKEDEENPEDLDDEDEKNDEEEKDDSDEEPDEEGAEKDKDKKPKKKKAKEEKVKEEGQSLLKYLVSLNEAKTNQKKPETKKPEVLVNDDSVDVFDMALSKEEEELSKIFSTPIQQLIFRTLLLLGVSAEQISIRKFKVRKNVKDVSTLTQHHPQIKNILNKLGRDLVSKKIDIYKITEANETKVAGTIKDQLSTEISKKIYNLILALGIPEFLLTYKKTAFKSRIKNLAGIAIKHSRIKTYIYTLSDLLKAEHKSSLKEGYEEAKLSAETKLKEDEYKSSGLLEDFSSTKNFADLGTFSIVSMGEVGGTTLKVKNFSIEFSDEQYEKFVFLISKHKSGIIKSENLGKLNLISLGHEKGFVIKSVKPGNTDKYPFGVLISRKSVDKIKKSQE